MTSKERLINALKFRPVDRAPMMILLGETWLIAKENMSFKEFMDLPDLGVSLIVDTYAALECDSVTSGLGCWIGCLEAVGCPIETTHKGAAIEVKPCVINPEKDVPLLKISDIPSMLDKSPLIKKMMQQTAAMKKAVGDSKMVCGQIVGPFSAANMMVGVKEFMVLIGKRSPFVESLLEFTTAFCIELVRRYRENGADMMQVADPCSSGDLISPRSYAQHVVPTLQKLYGEMKKHYDTTMIHICGKAGMREPEIIKVGIDGFSVDSPVDIKTAMEEADGKLCMMGNFDPNGLLRLGTKQEVYDAAMINLKAAGLAGGYVLMPGCDLAAGTPPENIRTLVEASKAYAASQH